MNNQTMSFRTEDTGGGVELLIINFENTADVTMVSCSEDILLGSNLTVEQLMDGDDIEWSAYGIDQLELVLGNYWAAAVWAVYQEWLKR